MSKKGNSVTMNSIETYIRILEEMKVFSFSENHALLSDLIGCHVFEGESILMPFLIKGDMDGFRKKAQEMNSFKLKGVK